MMLANARRSGIREEMPPKTGLKDDELQEQVAIPVWQCGGVDSAAYSHY